MTLQRTGCPFKITEKVKTASRGCKEADSNVEEASGLFWQVLAVHYMWQQPPVFFICLGNEVGWQHLRAPQFIVGKCVIVQMKTKVELVGRNSQSCNTAHQEQQQKKKHHPKIEEGCWQHRTFRLWGYYADGNGSSVNNGGNSEQLRVLLKSWSGNSSFIHTLTQTTHPIRQNALTNEDFRMIQPDSRPAWIWSNICGLIWKERCHCNLTDLEHFWREQILPH